jgi:pyruvate dehydrogenase E2 component (dihydrolipoamide acetyltransferase)
VDVRRVTGSGIGGRITREDVEGFARGRSAPAGKVRATPSARRIARELGVELNQLQGTGPHGRVQTPDVILFTQTQPFGETQAHSDAPVVGIGTEADAIPMSSIRRTIASRVQQSYQQVPHIFLDADIDLTAIEELRADAGTKVSITAFITRITAWALTKHPFINSRLDGGNILLMKNINIGIAVALEDGLIVPVIRNADLKPVLQIANEISSLTERARANQLKLDDLADGTFTISNLGMFGVDRFTAIINPPQTAILAVSRAAKKFVPDENDQPVLRPMMTVTLSVDHRVIDGALAAQFLRDLRDGLERPGRIIL